jgi:methyl-accepting chemotaxis protein
MFWRALSLRSKLLFLTLAGLVCMGLFTYFLMRQSFSSRQIQARGEMKSKAVLASQAISAVFRERYMDVQAFAANAVFLGQNKDAMTQSLNTYVENYKAYDAILFVDAEGKFVASNSHTFDGKPLDQKNIEGRAFSDTPWFQRAVKGQFFEDKAKGIAGSVVEDIQVDPLSSALLGSTQYGMSFSRAVVLPDGKLVGVVTARTSLRFIETELRGVFDVLQESVLRTAQAILINREGWLVAEVSSETVTERSELKRNPERVLRWNLATQQGQLAATEAVAGRAGSAVEIDRVGRIERVWGYNPLRDSRFLDQLGWSVVVSTSSDELWADLYTQRRWFLFGFSVLLIVFGLFGHGAARLTSREFLEYSLRLKDECGRLAELGDGLNRILSKASNTNSENHVVLNTVTTTVKSIYNQTEECEKTLSETVQRSRELKSKASLSEHAVQRVGVEMTLARTSAEQLAGFERDFQELTNKIGSLSEFIFKTQLAGTNAQIEAARAGFQGKGIATLGQDLEVVAEQADAVYRDISDGMSKVQSRLMNLSGSVRRSVNDSENLMLDARANLAQFPADFSSIAESLEAVQDALVAREEALKSVFESMLQADGSGVRTNSVYVELKRGLHELHEQSDRVDELIQDMAAVVKGQRVRTRGRKSSASFSDAASVFKRGSEISPDQARADVVDRLAQKMRPRLVVKSEESEPEVNDLGADESAPRRVG